MTTPVSPRRKKFSRSVVDPAFAPRNLYDFLHGVHQRLSDGKSYIPLRNYQKFQEEEQRSPFALKPVTSSLANSHYARHYKVSGEKMLQEGITFCDLSRLLVSRKNCITASFRGDDEVAITDVLPGYFQQPLHNYWCHAATYIRPPGMEGPTASPIEAVTVALAAGVRMWFMEVVESPFGCGVAVRQPFGDVEVDAPAYYDAIAEFAFKRTTLPLVVVITAMDLSPAAQFRHASIVQEALGACLAAPPGGSAAWRRHRAVPFDVSPAAARKRIFLAAPIATPDRVVSFLKGRKSEAPGLKGVTPLGRGAPAPLQSRGCGCPAPPHYDGHNAKLNLWESACVHESGESQPVTNRRMRWAHPDNKQPEQTTSITEFCDLVYFRVVHVRTVDEISGFRLSDRVLAVFPSDAVADFMSAKDNGDLMRSSRSVFTVAMCPTRRVNAIAASPLALLGAGFTGVVSNMAIPDFRCRTMVAMSQALNNAGWQLLPRQFINVHSCVPPRLPVSAILQVTILGLVNPPPHAAELFGAVCVEAVAGASTGWQYTPAMPSLVPMHLLRTSSEDLQSFPFWGERFRFPITCPGLTALGFRLYNHGTHDNDVIGEHIVPLSSLRAGIRVVPLGAPESMSLCNHPPSFLVHVSVENAPGVPLTKAAHVFEECSVSSPLPTPRGTSRRDFLASSVSNHPPATTREVQKSRMSASLQSIVSSPRRSHSVGVSATPRSNRTRQVDTKGIFASLMDESARVSFSGSPKTPRGFNSSFAPTRSNDLRTRISSQPASVRPKMPAAGTAMNPGNLGLLGSIPYQASSGSMAV